MKRSEYDRASELICKIREAVEHEARIKTLLDAPLVECTIRVKTEHRLSSSSIDIDSQEFIRQLLISEYSAVKDLIVILNKEFESL